MPPRGQRGCYRRDSVTWSPGESRWGSPFLLSRQFSTTDLPLNFGGQKGPHARPMGDRDVSGRPQSPSPATAGAEGGRSIVQQSRAACSIQVSVLQGFTLTCVEGTKKIAEETQKVMKPTDAANSHWETPEAANSLGMGVSRGKVNSRKFFLLEAPTLHMLGGNCQTSPFLPPAALQQQADHRCFCTSSFPHCSCWSTAAQSLGSGPPAVPSGEAKSMEERKGAKPDL